MSTFEMVCWGLAALYGTVVIAGLGFMILSGKRKHPESDALVAEADELNRRQQAEASDEQRRILAGDGF